MKNSVLTIIFVLMSFVGFSQKDTSVLAEKDVDFMLESQFYPRLNSGVFEPSIKARILFSNEHILRSNLNFMYHNNFREILEVNGNGVGSVEDRNQDLLLSLGYAYLFQGKKLRPYLGFELLFGVGKDEVFGSRTDSTVFVADFNYSSKISSSQIGLGVFSGIDFYVFDRMYIGTELGFQFLRTNYARGEFKQTDASSTTDPETITVIPQRKVSVFGPSSVGVIRVGWKF